MPTFGWGLRAVGSNLPHAGAVATECDQARDDGRLAKADVAHDHDALADAGVWSVEVDINLLEEPLTSSEDRVHGNAGHFKEQRFESNVLRSIGCKTHWRVREREKALT